MSERESGRTVYIPMSSAWNGLYAENGAMIEITLPPMGIIPLEYSSELGDYNFVLFFFALVSSKFWIHWQQIKSVSHASLRLKVLAFCFLDSKFSIRRPNERAILLLISKCWWCARVWLRLSSIGELVSNIQNARKLTMRMVNTNRSLFATCFTICTTVLAWLIHMIGLIRVNIVKTFFTAFFFLPISNG